MSSPFMSTGSNKVVPVQGILGVQSAPIQGSLVQGTIVTVQQQVVVGALRAPEPTSTYSAPTNGTSFKVPSKVPNSVTTPSGKIYELHHLFEDPEQTTASAFFSVDPLRSAMGNRSIKFWPKLLGCMIVCTCLINFLMIVVPVCGYFCVVLGGQGDTRWDTYIPCNSSQYRDDATCDDGIQYISCADRGLGNVTQCCTRGSKECREGFPTNGKEPSFWSRNSRTTAAGSALMIGGYIMLAWVPCWMVAFVPARGIGPLSDQGAFGALHGPQTSRLLFTIVALSTAVMMLVVLPFFMDEQVTQFTHKGLFPGLPIYWWVIIAVLLNFFGAYRFVVGTCVCKNSSARKNTHASLLGFISVSAGNVIFCFCFVQLVNLYHKEDKLNANGERCDGGECSEMGDAIGPYMPPMLLFFFMLIYLVVGRCYYFQILAWLVVQKDKKTYDRIWSQEKQQLTQAPASTLKKSKHGTYQPVFRPSGQMFYINRTASDATKRSTNIITQPFDGDIHPHNRVVSLFYFSKFANAVFQQYVNEWSSAVPVTHAKNSPVKSPARAVQKLQRSYGLGNALRLLDLVRASIVCPDLHSLAQVVEIIHQDVNRVKVLREKNGWADGYVSPSGYRNHQMIVQVLDVSCAGFLCEIQLDLQKFHDEKNRPGGSGHANYKKRRNYRGE